MISLLKKIITANILSIVLIMTAYGEGESISLVKGAPKLGWLVFGDGIMDSGSDPGNRELIMDVDWNHAVWGVGGSFIVENPLDGKKLKAFRAKIKTANGSETKVFAGIATKDDANLVSDIEKAMSVTGDWQTLDFPISEMMKDEPDVNSRMFTEDDWDKIQIVKLLFTKPKENGPMRDRILIRNPELISK